MEEETEKEEDDKNVREWVAIRGECISGGDLNDLCNLVAASQGKADVEVVQKKLVCGCILVPADSDEDIIL